MPFFDIATSKSAPELRCFVPFPLGNVFRATTACTFSTSQGPKVLWTCHFLTLLTWKRVSRHNGVQFFTSHLASWLRTRRFSEPTFRPSGGTNHWKNTVFRDFSTFSRAYIFFLLRLSLFWSSFFFSSLLFPSLLFSDSSHLCFSSVHTVGSSTSKLTSVSNTSHALQTNKWLACPFARRSKSSKSKLQWEQNATETTPWVWRAFKLATTALDTCNYA